MLRTRYQTLGLALGIAALALFGLSMRHRRVGARAVTLASRLEEAQPQFHREIVPALVQYCFDCHGDGAAKGGVSLDGFTNVIQVFEQRAVWERVLENLRSGLMPPPTRKQPDLQQRQEWVRFLDGVLYPLDRENPDPGRVTIRRLNRSEYNNTIRDLLGVDFHPASDFPQDDVGYGFDNIGDVLSVPLVLLEKYSHAADRILEEALPIGPVKPQSKYYGPMEIQGHDHSGELYAVASASGELSVSFEVKQAGEYLLQVNAFGKQIPERISKEKVKMALLWERETLATHEVAAKSENPRNFEARVPLSEGTHNLRISFLNPGLETEVKEETRPSGRVVKVTNRFERELAVNSVKVIGPFTDAAPRPTEFQQWLFGGTSRAHKLAVTNLSTLPEKAAEVLERFATRAYRRPATKEELDRLMGLYREGRVEKPYLEALRHAMKGILVSSSFLFRGELQPEPDNPKAIFPISEYDLAARLSYFLWSSMPDQRLVDLAQMSQLRIQLKTEVQRMLQDPKSQALTDNFAGQWLQLRLLDLASPDRVKFPDFDEHLRRSMVTETEMLFDDIVRNDRPLTEFLTADYTFLNERLARHYGFEGVKGREFQKVSLAGTPRGGILTHGSFLTFSSNPTRTSPVKRGKWVLDNLLGMPPPPPPPNVPELGERNIKGTLRQRLEEHRANPTCASCHNRMDPIGFALEHFDGIGRYREKDGELAIESADVLHTGEKFQDHAELRQLLAGSHAQDFARTISEKLLTYALGRGLEWYDRPTLQQLQTRMAAGGYRFSELIMGIVESIPFQKRRGEGNPFELPPKNYAVSPASESASQPPGQ